MNAAFQLRIQRYGWDRAAPYYDNSWQKQLWPAQQRLLKLASLSSGMNVLDVACGTGLVSFPIARAVAPGKLTGVDLSEQMVKTAQKAGDSQGLNMLFKRMEAEKLDFPDNSFDHVLCSLGLMYTPDPLKALQEMHRVLAPGGKATVLVWGQRKNCGWADIFPIVDRRVKSDVCPLFFQQGTGNVLKQNMDMAGFDEITDERFSIKLQFDSEDSACGAAFEAGPVALAYRKFDELIKTEVHKEYLDSISTFKNGGGYEIPGEFVIASGHK